MGRRVAILGGTFNPVHCGHLIIADQALGQFALDEVLWIPAGDPPHKPLAAGATSQDRLEMVKLAIADHARFSWSDVEIRRQGRSYAVDTVSTLVREQPDTEWHWVIGADALRDLPSWHQIERLVTLCKWIVAPRVGAGGVEELIVGLKQRLPVRAFPLLAPYIEISSTFLREQVQRGGSIRYLVPTGVEDYIRERDLYR